MTDPRIEILELVAKYAVYLDAGEFDALEAIFADDATYDIDPDPGIVPVPVHGSRAIREALEARYREVTQTAQRRHVMSNTVVDELGETTARSRTFLTVLSAPKAGGGVELRGTGVYVDSFERRGGRWQFTSRRLELDALGT